MKQNTILHWFSLILVGLATQSSFPSANAAVQPITEYRIGDLSNHQQFFYDHETEQEHLLAKRETDAADEKLKKAKKATTPVEKSTEKLTASTIAGASNSNGKTPKKPLLGASGAPGELSSGNGSADLSPSDASEVTEPMPTNTKIDNHTYYIATSIFDNEVLANSQWVDMDKLNSSVRHPMLSSAHRRAATVRLSFRFPFYGHEIENITIATGGFLYLGEAIHTWLAATQYIAPLMANFNTSISNQSNIYYYDNGTAFTVQWDNVYLQENNTASTANGTNTSQPQIIGQPFSFQVTLHKNGDIVFVYLKVPVPIDQISEDKHPVKVGISDAYIIERTMFIIRRKTIYEYHKVEMKKQRIGNFTVINFRAQPTCISIKDCDTCLKPNQTSFDCMWCESLGRCSDGYDRFRHHWLTNNCDDQSNDQRCPTAKDTKAAHTASGSENSNSQSPKSDTARQETTKPKSGSRLGFFSLLMLVSMVSGLVFWSFYAYKNPQSSSGQFLIKYRPTQWRFGQTEA